MEDKFTTQDYPRTGVPKTGPLLAAPFPQGQTTPAKKPNAFVRFLKFVFVKDFAIKAAALVTGAAMFLLTAGLGAL